MLPGPGTLWIGVEIALEEDQLVLDKNGRPIRGNPTEIAVVSASVERRAKGIVEIQATLGPQELLKLGRFISVPTVGTDSALPLGAQEFEGLGDSGFSDHLPIAVAFVKAKTKPDGFFEGVGLYSAKIELMGFRNLTVTGYSDPNRPHGKNVGYIGLHRTA
jgi:hypothetical protein